MSLQAIEFDLQITPGSVPPVLHMAQYDSGRQYTAYLKDETNTAFIPGTGATAKIKGFNAAGVAWEQEATVDGSTVVFTPSGAATDQFGVMPVTIEISVGDETLTPLLVVFDIQRAGYTNEEAARSPEFQTAIEAAVAAAIEEGGLGFSDDFKEALLACFAHVAWADEEGQTYYDALQAALYPAVTLVSITADYEQDRHILDTDSLDPVRLDLVVTANYSDGTSETLADDAYTLTGTLTVGTSTITVGYEGKTAEISVVVTSGYRTATIADVASSIGFTNLSVNSSGTFSATGVQTFSIAALLQTIKRFRYAPLNTYVRVIFRKESDGSFYGIDSTKVFKFSQSGAKYTAAEVQNPSSITTRADSGAWYQGSLNTITIDDDGVFRIEDENGNYTTLTNANVIGIWCSNAQQLLWTNCEVGL